MSWTHDRCCDAVEAEVARFADVVRGTDPSTPVPTCPDWTVAELVRHAGAVHRWAGQMVAALAQERLDRRQVVLDLPADESDLPDDPHLKAVDLSSTSISDAQLSYLSGLTGLEKLNLEVTQVGDLVYDGSLRTQLANIRRQLLAE